MISMRWVRSFSARAIPIIDMKGLEGTSTQQAAVLKEISRACEKWGFFQVINHGINPHLIERTMQETRSFFELPLAAKLSCERSVDNFRGYFNRELTKQKVDWKEGFDFGPPNETLNTDGKDGGNRWPNLVSHHLFRPTLEGYYHAVEKLSQRLLECIALSVGLPETFFHPYFIGNNTSFLRLNHYPVCPNPKEEKGVGHHTDSGALTVLLQQDRVSSLQVFNDGEWIDIAPKRGALTINVGDMLQVWSNDKFIAALHQVKAHADKDRISLPFFYNPTFATDVVPLPTCVSPTNPPRYRTVNWGEFRNGRYAGDYADLGEEIQITHYKIQ